MRQSEQINELASAMAKAQAGMTNAAINRENPFFKSKYADLAAVREATIPHLTEHGLSLTQTTGYRDGKLFLFTTLLHASGQWREGEWPLQEGKPQEMGSAMTYGRRFSWNAMCGIAAEEDDDGNHANEAAKKQADAHEKASKKKLDEYMKAMRETPDSEALEEYVRGVAGEIEAELTPSHRASLRTFYKTILKEKNKPAPKPDVKPAETSPEPGYEKPPELNVSANGDELVSKGVRLDIETRFDHVREGDMPAFERARSDYVAAMSKMTQADRELVAKHVEDTYARITAKKPPQAEKKTADPKAAFQAEYAEKATALRHKNNAVKTGVDSVALGKEFGALWRWCSESPFMATVQANLAELCHKILTTRLSLAKSAEEVQTIKTKNCNESTAKALGADLYSQFVANIDAELAKYVEEPREEMVV